MSERLIRQLCHSVAPSGILSQVQNTSNSFDTNAIKVFGRAEGNEWHIGYVDGETAKDAATDLVPAEVPIAAELYSIYVSEGEFIEIKYLLLAPKGYSQKTRVNRLAGRQHPAMRAPLTTAPAPPRKPKASSKAAPRLPEPAGHAVGAIRKPRQSSLAVRKPTRKGPLAQNPARTICGPVSNTARQGIGQSPISPDTSGAAQPRKERTVSRRQRRSAGILLGHVIAQP
jgi:hypothetical protein